MPIFETFYNVLTKILRKNKCNYNTINELREIKDSIVRTDRLLDDGIPVKLDKATMKSINCYAYSLGIMFNNTTRTSYTPGFTESLRYYGEGRKELIQKVCIDLKNLDISFRKLPLKGKIVLGENEYLIKVFYTPPNKNLLAGDFHFVRQDRKTGKWFHKWGWNKQPELTQSDSCYEGPTPGSEPTKFQVNDNWEIYIYEPIVYFAITEN